MRPRCVHAQTQPGSLGRSILPSLATVTVCMRRVWPGRSTTQPIKRYAVSDRPGRGPMQGTNHLHKRPIFSIPFELARFFIPIQSSPPRLYPGRAPPCPARHHAPTAPAPASPAPDPAATAPALPAPAPVAPAPYPAAPALASP
jgi:hypothetical protein